MLLPQVEDIIDTGATLRRVVDRLQEAGAASVKVRRTASGGAKPCTYRLLTWAPDPFLFLTMLTMFLAVSLLRSC